MERFFAAALWLQQYSVVLMVLVFAGLMVTVFWPGRRERFERELKRSGQLTSSSDPNVQELKGADFFLTGKLSGLTTKTKAGVSDYILYTFQLVDARTSDILWEDSAEIKKQGVEDAAYR